jgi:hypothetical protein
MPALLVSIVVSLLPAMPSASVTCAEAPASCDGAWLPAAPAEVQGQAQGQLDDGPVDYATPAEVECPTPPTGDGQVGTCDPTPLDLWYRVSRVPESESGGTTIAPARRSRGGRVASSCGTPLPDAGYFAPPSAQPAALYAVPTLLAEWTRLLLSPDARELPARALAPPDRPPRV